MGVCVECEMPGRQVKKRKKWHFSPQLSNSSGENNGLRRHSDRGQGIQKRRQKATKISHTFATAAAPHQELISTAQMIFSASFHKNTNQLWYYANDGHAPLHFHLQCPHGCSSEQCFMQQSPPLFPSLSLSFPKCWIYLPLAAIVMTPPTDPLAWKLVAGKVVVRD